MIVMARKIRSGQQSKISKGLSRYYSTAERQRRISKALSKALKDPEVLRKISTAVFRELWGHAGPPWSERRRG